ncbi:hypothetical protein HYV70_02060 [Candidatus Uhrbacteria bacterium]|nr:hypothetical protein [Candidatus Uhrbacteria bacterium]
MKYHRRIIAVILFSVITVGLLFAKPIVAQTSTSAPKLLTPTLQVDIPGVKFSEGKIEGKILKVNYLGDYIAGIYKYLIGISTTIAIVMLMIGGLQWSLGASSQENISKAKKRINNAVIGLVLLLSVYTILFIVNPNLTFLKTPEIQVIQYANLESVITTAIEECKDVKGIVQKCSATTLKNPSGWSADLTNIVNSVATTQGVDAILLATHIQKETSGNINYSRNIGPCGEIGISQFMPTTFESIVGQQCCTSMAAKNASNRESYGKLCDNGAVDAWPPKTSDIPHCNTSICGNCQVAMTSCIDYFDTSKPNGVQNSVTATAKLIKYNLSNGRIAGDVALAMCAYNGSGKQAAAYAQEAAKIYEDFCKNSGGTLGGSISP